MTLSTLVQQKYRENRTSISGDFHRSDTLNFPDRRSWQLNAVRHTNRHWHPESEKYAGVDCLLSALDEGWIIDGLVFGEVHRFGGGRQTTVYQFTLTRNGATMVMPVIENPHVAHLTTTLTI